MKRLSVLALLVTVVPFAPAHAGPASRYGGCSGAVDRGSLPVWARAGFRGSYRIPHVLGKNGSIAAILFGDPLSSPPSPERANKILWVSRHVDPNVRSLYVRARRQDGAGTAYRRLAVGPSYLDLPSAGCWRLFLRWGSQVDLLDLRYRSPSQ